MIRLLLYFILRSFISLAEACKKSMAYLAMMGRSVVVVFFLNGTSNYGKAIAKQMGRSPAYVYLESDGAYPKLHQAAISTPKRRFSGIGKDRLSLSMASSKKLAGGLPIGNTVQHLQVAWPKVPESKAMVYIQVTSELGCLSHQEFIHSKNSELLRVAYVTEKSKEGCSPLPRLVLMQCIRSWGMRCPIWQSYEQGTACWYELSVRGIRVFGACS